MRKQTKLVAVLSATALLAVGASMTSFAKGWNQLDNGDWEYLDSEGERVTNSWKKYGSQFFFLGEDGLLVRNQLIKPEDSSNNSDDYYYVDENGAKVVNEWRMVENEDDTYVNGEEVGVLYYYFGANGKAYKADNSTTFKKKLINWAGKDRVFFFDEDAHMVSGWVQPDNDPDHENFYYCGEETQGYAQVDWQLLEVPEFMKASSPHDDAYEDWEWFCFDGNGKMRRAKEKDAAGNQLIPNDEVTTWYDSGWYYTFDCFGVYQDDWYKVPVATGNYIAKATASEVNAYSAYSGVEQKAGWVLADNDDDGESDWYYLVKVDDKRNVPFNTMIKSTNPNDIHDRATSINKKVYYFDTNGVMKDGLVTVDTAIPADNLGGRESVRLEAGIYLFSKDAATKGQMLKGKRSYTDEGETSYYYFHNNTGKAYEKTIIDNIIYGPDGKRLQAEDGNKYEIKDITYDVLNQEGTEVRIPRGSRVIVSNTGKVATQGTKRKVEDSNYVVGKDNDGKWTVTRVESNINY